MVRPRRAGFTVIELMFAVTILSVLAAIALPRVSDWVAATRVENAARVVAADFQQALALASRQGAPVRLLLDATDMRLQITDRGTGAVLHSRGFGAGTDFQLAATNGTGWPAEVFPNRVVSGPISLTLVAGEHSTRVEMTSAGFIRIVVL